MGEIPLLIFNGIMSDCDAKFLEDIHAGLLEVILDFDRIMKENHLEYSLISGTELGAVRHKGFIPWDDDLDVCIKECDVPKLISIFDNDKNDKYFLQKPLSIDWINTFFKLKLNGSTAIEKSHLNTRMHQGLFVDIFIVRNYPDSRLMRRLYKLLVIGQRACRRSSDIFQGKPKRDWIQKLVQKIYSIDYKLCGFISNNDSKMMFIDFPCKEFRLLDREIVNNYTDVVFENHELRMFADYDTVLTTLFGPDYMTPPPENKRYGEHLVAYDRNTDYKVWLEEYHKQNNKTN